MGKSGRDFWIADILEQGIIINYRQVAETGLNSLLVARRLRPAELAVFCADRIWEAVWNSEK